LSWAFEPPGGWPRGGDPALFVPAGRLDRSGSSP
jgi:hypothetical protein